MSREATRAIAHAIESVGARRWWCSRATRSTCCARRAPTPTARSPRTPRLAAALDRVPRARPSAGSWCCRGCATPRSRTTTCGRRRLRANGWTVALACVLEIDTGAGAGVVRVEPGHQLDPAASFTDPATPTTTRSRAPRARSAARLRERGEGDVAQLAGGHRGRRSRRHGRARRVAVHVPPAVPPGRRGSRCRCSRCSRCSSRSRRSRRGARTRSRTSSGCSPPGSRSSSCSSWSRWRSWSCSCATRSARSRGCRGRCATTTRRAASRSALAAAGGAGLDHRALRPGRADRSRRRRVLRELRDRGPHRRSGRDARRAAAGVRGPAAVLVGRARGRLGAARPARGTARATSRSARCSNGSRRGERITCAGRRPRSPSIPGTVTWPSAGDATALRRRTRRIGATAIAFAGVLNLASAVTLPLASRLGALGRFAPIEVPEVAAALVAICGIGLLLLARGVRRGQRHAWSLAIALLLVAVVGNVTKGLDVEEAIDRAARRRVPRRPPRRLRRAREPVVVARGARRRVARASWSRSSAGRRRRVAAPAAVAAEITQAVAERLVGVKDDRVAEQHRPASCRPRCSRSASSSRCRSAGCCSGPRCRRGCRRTGRCRASGPGSSSSATAPTRCRTSRCATTRSGSASATRSSRTACTTASRSVSPDPIGPVGQRAEAWGAFREFADEHGWPVAVMGACADWLPVYGASGMHDLYIGDEAVVDVRRFSLDGKQNKSLRQSVGPGREGRLPRRVLRPVAARARDGGQAPRR